ncbi:MAG: DUF309 domain-containing protein [Candidatus Omnitrophica bacterium]|nr:DUF309 domain-containing protein [Candidatus Omnitrophota bacterium]
MKPAEYLEFIELFNREKFFEAHEVLELLWRREKGGVHRLIKRQSAAGSSGTVRSARRDFYHGLIQIAAACVHIQRGTPEGGKQLLTTSAKYLKPYLPIFMELNLEKLLAETRAALFEGGKFPRLTLGKK